MAEFDAFFAEVVTEGRSAEPSVAGRAAELTAAETGCCSFFTLTLTATGGALGLETSVSDRHTKVLDALTARAAEVMGVSGLRS